MEVRCDKCQARYRVDDARIGPQGLTMRCGKCQNTFKVTRAAEARPAAPEPAPAAPAPKAARPPPAKVPEPGVNATMVFGQSPLAPRPAAPPAKAPAPKPAARPAAAPPPADEGAGRTMMFQTGNLKTSPPTAKPAPKPAEPETGATMVFGQSPVAKPPARPAGNAAEPGAGATMVFGQSPVAPVKPAIKTPAGARAAPAPAPSPAPAPQAEPEPPAEEPAPEPQGAAEPEPAPDQEEAPAEEEAARESVEAEGAEEEEAEAPGAFDKAPPRGLLIGVVAGLAALVVAGGVVVAVKKLGKRPPPPAAVETLTTAQAEADKDTLASLAAAEAKARDALEVAGPRAYFPDATAALARIEIQWADALEDQANQVTQKGGDGAEAKANELTAQARARLKAAFERLSPAIKADSKSPDLDLALADYYRAQRSNTMMSKALKSAQALHADEAQIALVQGLAAAQQDDGADKAVPLLKAALAGHPGSARIHFRLALAYQALRDDANASAELKETLKLSPQHERARAAMEQMAAAAAAEGK